MRKPNFGYDAPGVLRNLSIAAGAMLIFTIASFLIPLHPIIAVLSRTIFILFFFCFFVPGLGMLLYSRIYKISNRDKLIKKLGLKGDETILDIGCGRGLYAIGFAETLENGHVYGIDIWKAEDISGNSESSIMENIRRSGQEKKITLKTEDMRAMSFADGMFDIAVASFSIHNIYEINARRKALDEISRVMKIGGTVIIINFANLNQYKMIMVETGFNLIGETRVKGAFPPARNLVFKKM